ncbi:GntR family transcriptional regulator [Streptomyces sp. RLB3-6]|uniref:GntR family transcriptional regulator n=1 Tax=Streptomyces sp. RLB3-6 TaxID=2594457 RepID=UPI001163F34B|nr:GntR family transcriptional regulator [Streptomyces sp. RLB3-6]QDN93464.1 GntR family transcriptional regulator [Streptomyces sp. RLB3-6]
MAQSTRAYTELRSLIVCWDLPPGSPLNEVQLAERLGISRTPLRQAIQRLAHEGLVRLTPGRGAQVSEITLQDVVSLFQMREALETYAARLCARRPDRARFADLQAAFETQRAQFETAEPEGGDYGPYYALIAQLDEAVDAGAQNPYLLSSLAGLRGHLERLRQIARRRPQRMLQTAAEHQAICAAIHEGNESLAAQATAVHINNSLRHILAALAEDVGGSEAAGFLTARRDD